MSDKQGFIRELAKYLAGRGAEMCIRLEANPNDPVAQQWLKLREETPLFGYPPQAEAEEVLRRFLCT
jgi:hypothetical protein